MARMASLSRLKSIRAENRAARVVDGLGAVNIPFARQFGRAWLEVDPSKSLSGGEYMAQFNASRAALRVLDAQLRVQDSRLTAMFVKLRGFTRAAAGAASTVSTRATLAARLTARGFGRVGGMDVGRTPLKLNARGLTIGRVAGAAIVGQASAGALNLAADTQDRLRERLKGAFTPTQFQRAVTMEAKQIGSDLVVGTADTVASLVGLKSLVTAGLRFQGFSKAGAADAMDMFIGGVRKDLNQFFGGDLAERISGKAKQAMHKAALAIEEAIRKAWENIDADLPDTFMVRARDMAAFKKEQHQRNEALMKAKREGLYDEARKAIRARVNDGG